MTTAICLHEPPHGSPVHFDCFLFYSACVEQPRHIHLLLHYRHRHRHHHRPSLDHCRSLQHLCGTMMSTSSYSRGRSLPRHPPASHSASPSLDMDVNNILVHHPLHHRNASTSSSAAYYNARDRTPSPVRRNPYIGSSSPSPPGPSRTGSLLGHPPLSPSSLGDVKKLHRSSVLHLRNLSEFTRDQRDPVLGLRISEIEKEEVPGIAGRKRLARGETQNVYAGNKLWVDKQRQVIQTYEYLCHVGEAKQYGPHLSYSLFPASLQRRLALLALCDC